MAYFDNAATTFPKPECVYDYMDSYYRAHGGSAGRGKYEMAQSAGGLISDTRKKIQDILHCQTKQVVFTPSATIAMNIIIQGLLKKEIKNVYISPFEHNAVTRTLHAYEKQGRIRVHQLDVSKDYKYNIEKIKYQFETIRPDLVIVSHASNVIGLIAPIESIFSLAKKYEAITVADMAQTAGLVDVNIGLSIFDFAVFAGHKTLFGPTGISGFVMNPDIMLPTTIYGGTGYDSANQDMPDSIPEKYEMGTLNISGIAGLNAALKWIETKHIESLRDKEIYNRNRLLDILSEYDFIHPIGIEENANYVGIVSCVIDGISSDSAGGIFDKQGIAVRTGLQCAPLAHKFIGTYPAGTIRFSVNYFTSEKDFEELIAALEYIEENL